MNNIKRLRRSVHNSLRSSIILFDLPRVVEELTYNSLDSGATKVHVSISVRACYVKVEDDGCGITRDGLVILGERYATSKIHLLADTESNSERLGFRGEALASLSDVSLVEIRTKARGRPNAYCKIMKGSKCLFFGIDDQREAVGTTVIVRDLFYNQPVRRKYIHSSPKRVLHSAKKYILRIALVHPQVSFKVTDIESEDELLGTIPSSSPLPLVSDGFGNEVSSSLQEIVFSDQILMLTGYISGLTNAFSTKAFQYLYINSRFVCKGPIHNLLNSLAASFQLSLSQLKVKPEFQSGKRHKTQGYPAYLLNLCCPLSSYDLHYEPSKTIVEFKDWNTILSFFEQAIRHFWEQLSAKSLQGKTFAHDADVPIESEIPKEDVFIAGILKSSKTRKSKCDIQLHQNLPSHSPMTSTLDISLEDINVYQKHGISCEEMHRSSVLKPCQNETGYLDQADYSSQHVIHDSHDAFASTHAQMGCANSNTQQWTADVGSCLLENHFFSNQTPKFKDEDDISEIEWKDNPPEGSRSLKKELNQNLLTCGPYDIINNTEEIQFPLACLSAHSSLEIESSPLMQNEQGCSAYYTNHSDFGVGFDHLGNDFSLYDTVDAAEAEYHKESLIWDTLFQEKKDASRPSFGVIRKCQLTKELDISASDPITPFSCEEACLGEENNLHDGLASEIWIAGSKCGSPEIDWHLGSPQLFCASTLRTVHDFTQGCTSRGNLMPFKGSGCRYSGISEEKAEILNSVQNNSNEVFPTGYTKTKLDYPYCFSPERNYGSPSNQITFGEVSSSGKLNDETGWSFVETSNITNTSICGKYAFNFSVQNQDEGAENPWGDQEFQNCRPSNVHKVRSRRSCSAPPFYKGKHKFSILNDHLTTAEGKDSIFQSSYDAKISPETICSFNGLSQPCCVHPYLKPNLNDVFQPFSRECVDEKLSTHEMNGMQNIGGFDDVHYNQSSHTNAAEGSITDELEYALATPTKWRTGIPQPTDRDVSHNYPENKEDILNISSGLLHLSGSSLVPESINKDCLEDARVLLQLDRKFIPVMADGILVIIDQHAADERIRLEELRQKVLSGEGKSITYLESEQELVLPEMGFQLLQKYTEQIQKWGWMCNIHSQCSESFAKNMNLLKRRARGVTLVAVPCILGINLTDKDLIEFIEQLVETDGSSTFPPSVLRILNFKACRGAIMFGDSLLPSECSLIVEELKATSLCFQCAHGRPTTVPLLNMASLHEQLARLEMGKGGLGETWHGLRRHAPRIERAQLRLESAKRFHGG